MKKTIHEEIDVLVEPGNEVHGQAVKALDSEFKGPEFESATCMHFVPLSKMLYSDCAVLPKIL